MITGIRIVSAILEGPRLHVRKRFSAPDGLTWGTFKNNAGADIRYSHTLPVGEPKGAIVIVGGFREPSEKYFEVAREKLAEGFEVYTMDWRGAGGSARYLADPMKSHSNGFDEQIDTLHTFTQDVI